MDLLRFLISLPAALTLPAFGTASVIQPFDPPRAPRERTWNVVCRRTCCTGSLPCDFVFTLIMNCLSYDLDITRQTVDRAWDGSLDRHIR